MKINTIENLNVQYENTMKVIGILQIYEERICIEQKKAGVLPAEKMARSVEHLKNLLNECSDTDFRMILDTTSLAAQYLNCLNAIKEYGETLNKANVDNRMVVLAAVENIKNAQKQYDKLKADFKEEYSYMVDSVDALNNLISICIEQELSTMQKGADLLKSKAREYVSQQSGVRLQEKEFLQNNKTLPIEMLVARYLFKETSYSILKDIGVTDTYQDIKINLRKQGNILISSDFKDMDDESIDVFVLAYILRYIEAFPLGTVNIHIFDRNTNYLYKRLYNSFQSEDAGEAVKNIVRIHTSLNDLSALKEVDCEDIFNKTSTDRPDLYSVYETDQSDRFNLIVLRDGLVDGTGYQAAEILEVIEWLTKPDNTGHKCGFRFLIVDNSSSFEKAITANNQYLINAIHKNCEFILDYANGNFIIDGRQVEVLHIDGNLEAFVQNQSKAIANAINSKEKSYVSVEELSAISNDVKLGNIMYIPVGKSGGTVIELPLSCKDEDGTVAGQCIGYMAIGQSGSGKSSFFHSVVLNGCMRYSPEELQFWLLDFKNGGASSKYIDSGLPHVKMIAENNKIDDALCLFQMVLEEMDRRIKAFGSDTDNITEYNSKAIQRGLKTFPRIVIAIDEVQEIFREDNASILQQLISSISARMRCTGMHFIMIAQNLSEGKSYMLKDAFLPSATGRICFRVAQDIPREAGFEEEFVQRRQEIAELKTGEAYVSYGKNTIKRVKMAYASPQDMNEKYFVDICNKYQEYANMKPLVIGSKERLAITSLLQGKLSSYCDIMSELKQANGMYEAVIGEDVYRMSPIRIWFSRNENSSVLLLGSDKQIASSLCTSIAVSLLRQNVYMHLFNGDRTKIQEENEVIPHSFMYLCQNISSSNSLIQTHKLDELRDVIKDMYTEYLKREELAQKAEEDLEFPALFLIVNDLFGIKQFTSNETIENGIVEEKSEKPVRGGLGFDYDIFSGQSSSTKKENGQFSENIQKIMDTLVREGYRYNIYVILAIKGEPSAWRSIRIASEVNNVILFKSTEYANQMENSYYLKEMLKNISNNESDETMAVWSGHHNRYSKIRPIIYKMLDEWERKSVEKLIKGE